MSTETDTGRATTTVSVDQQVHERLKEIRPFDSMSFSELIDDMIDVYAEDSSKSAERL